MTAADDDLPALAAELQRLGQINPVVVTAQGDRFKLVAGYRRLRAAMIAGWTHIDATIDNRDAATLAAVRAAENITRRQLSPVEEAYAVHDLVELDGQGVDAVAAQLGRSPDWILKRLEILTYPEPLQRLLHAGKISQSAAHYLSRITDPSHLEDAIRIADVSGINAATARSFLSQYTNQSSPVEPDPGTVRQPTAAPAAVVPFVACHVCQVPTAFHDTTPIRLCAGCRQNIDAALTAPPPPPSGATPPPSASPDSTPAGRSS